jgi:hypothetical protein
MKLKTEPLLGAVAFGVVFLVVGSLISLMISYRTMQEMLNSPLFDPTFLGQNGNTLTAEQQAQLQESFGSFYALSGVGSLLSCLTWIVAGVGAGILYPILYKRYGVLESGAVGGGAAAGALANVFGYLFTSIISALLFLPLMNDWMNQMMTAAGPAATPPDFGMFWGMAFIIGAICGTLFMAVIGAIFGAIGGAIGGAIAK